MKRTLLPALLLLPLLAGACADAVTSSPDVTASGDALRSSGGDSESMLLASSYSGAEQPGWKTIGTLPDSAWVVIDVIGQVYHSKNPDCDALPPAWRPVNYPWDKLYAGPMFGGSQVAVRPIPGGGPYRLWPVNGDPETATHARALVYSRQSGMKLEVGRVSVMSLCGNPTAGQWAPLYTLAGGQQVTLTKIGSPLLFDAPDVIAPKQKATFAVNPHGSLRLLNPPGVNGKPGRLTWYYAPGDTLPEPVHAATGFMYEIPECLNEKVCEHAPEKSGRLAVNGYVEGTSVFRKSHVIRVDSAGLELVCGSERGTTLHLIMMRGEMFDCSVEATGASVRILEWKFDGGGHTVPSAGSSWTHTRWAGEMLISGVVSVRALLGQDTVAVTATVEVEPRPWVDQIAEPTVKYFRCPDELTATCPTKYPPEYINDLGRLDPGPQSWPAQWLRINSGPNAGFAFIPGEESFLNVREPWIVLNGILLDPDHDFWKDRPDCDVARMHDEILEHEQIHYELFREGIDSGFTPGWLESLVVYGTLEEVRSRMTETLQAFNTSLMNSADNDHTSPRFKGFHCDLRLPGKRQPPVPGRNRVN